MERYLKETELLDYKSPAIKNLVARRGWAKMRAKEQILSIYNYVRDEIRFGFNIQDAIPASRVLSDGYGQCNTKSVLFMALLRAVGLPCRIHGFTVKKELQKGALSGLWYRIAPAELVHTWVELNYEGEWLNIEGFILDLDYLSSLQKRFGADCRGNFCGYGVATDNFANPQVHWEENSTYIQKEGIKEDYGLYDEPDTLFGAHPQKIGLFKRFLFVNVVRHSINRNINRIRKQTV